MAHLLKNMWAWHTADRRKIDLRKLDLRETTPANLKKFMRMVRRELSLRFERKSNVFSDDSQLLYDRWHNREVWAWVGYYYNSYDLEGIGEVSQLDISYIRRSDAFSLSIPAIHKASCLGTLDLIKNQIESSVRYGFESPEKILERIVDSKLINLKEKKLEEISYPLELSTGFALVFATDEVFRGGVQIKKRRHDWEVIAIDEMTGVISKVNETTSTLIAASPKAYSTALQTQSFHDNEITGSSISALQKWIEKNMVRETHTRADRAKYDFAFSFAGEDRNIVEEIADKLTRRGFRVFYDVYEQAELWGKDLYQHLSSVYSEQSRFCVVFISQKYRDKLWTQHELRHAQSRAIKESGEYILPVRIDNTQLPGLPDTIGYVDLYKVGSDGIVELLSQKLERKP